MKKQKEHKTFAEVSWTAEDIRTLRPRWSHKKAEEWLAANAKYIAEAMVQDGWQAIDELLP